MCTDLKQEEDDKRTHVGISSETMSPAERLWTYMTATDAAKATAQRITTNRKYTPTQQ